jgi:hypothetical protein
VTRVGGNPRLRDQIVDRRVSARSARAINVCEIDVVTCISLLNDLSVMMTWWKDTGGTWSLLKAVDATD